MGKQRYWPLDQDDLVEAGRSENVAEDQHNEHRRVHRSSRTRLLCYCALLLSVLANVYQFWRQSPSLKSSEDAPSDFAIPIDVPTQYKQFWWNTEYSGGNATVQDTLWESILPSHGFVAMDRDWAAARSWPESMYLPGDKSKGVYLLEAYHQLHCLRILRMTMKQSLSGSEFTYKPGEHIEHCFDYLLQTAVCNADSTPLYTFGDNTAGHGQMHQCRDWEALKDFATKNTACYRDIVEDVPLGQHFGYCDDGEDGLILGTPQKVIVD